MSSGDGDGSATFSSSYGIMYIHLAAWVGLCNAGCAG